MFHCACGYCSTYSRVPHPIYFSGGSGAKNRNANSLLVRNCAQLWASFYYGRSNSSRSYRHAFRRRRHPTDAQVRTMTNESAL